MEWWGHLIETFFSGNNAGELIGYFWNRGFRLTGLYEIHGPFSGAPGLQWYIGPGVHVGFYNVKNGDGSFAGIDGVSGMNYKFGGAPINIPVDWQPSLEFGASRGFVGSWGRIRYPLYFLITALFLTQGAPPFETVTFFYLRARKNKVFISFLCCKIIQYVEAYLRSFSTPVYIITYLWTRH